jgi:hypothetical protein
VRSWFQPHIVENGSASVMPTAVARKAKTKSTFQEFAQQEGQDGLNNTSRTQHLSAPIGMMTLLPTSDRDGSGAMSLGTNPPDSQLRELPAETTPPTPTPEGSTAGMECLPPVLDSTTIQVSAPEADMSSPSANEIVRALAQLGRGTSQHQHSYSDPGQVHMCLVCHKFHWISNRSPHPAVFSLSEMTSTTGDMQIQRAMRNESWAIWMMRHVFTPINAVTWSFLCMYLVLLSKS